MDLKTLSTSLKNNIDLKNNKNIRHLANILKKYDPDISLDWKEYRQISDLTYNRLLVDKNEDFDMYIITWNTEQQSKIHNHSDNGCLFKILEGKLIEEYYNSKLELIGFKVFDKNNVGYIDNNLQYHNMINYTNNVAVSLHIYSPPNHKTEYFS